MREGWTWAALAGLGAFHGVNPAMGWLFAVALGLQERRRGAVLAALIPIAAGHALSIAVVIAALFALRRFVEAAPLQFAAAAVLIGFGVYRLVARHKARGRMRVGFGELVLWSFLMASAHGAGLMLSPVLLAMPMDATGHAGHAMPAAAQTTGAALLAIAVHSLAMLAVAGAIALVVYEWVGLAFLRRGWINLDLIWSLALIAAGAVTLVLALL